MTARRTFSLRIAAALALLAMGTTVRAQSPATAPAGGVDDHLTDFAGRRVDEVRVSGNAQVATAVILNVCQTKKGDKFNAAAVEEDYQKIYGLKRFSFVGARVEADDAGGVAVVFTVAEERLVHAVSIVGNRAITTEDLLKDADLKVGEAVEPFRIALAKRAIVAAYQAHNYPNAHVDVDAAKVARTGDVVFTVVEAQPVAVRDIRFVGAHSFTFDRLNGEVQVARYFPVFSAGTLDQQVLNRDVSALRRYYRNHGFLDVRVGHKEVVSPDQTEVRVEFLIDEGQQYTVDRVTFVGNKNVPTAKLLKDLQLVPGQAFDADLLNRDVDKIVGDYSPLGYIYDPRGAGGPKDLRIGSPAQDYPARLVPHLRPGTVELVYDIAEGVPQHVGRIIVTGNPDAQDKLALRYLNLHPGELYNSSAVQDATELLNGGGVPYFKAPTTITPIPPAGGEPDTRDVLIRVSEAQTSSVSASGAVNSSLGVSGNFGFQDRNFDIGSPSLRVKDLIDHTAWTGAGQELDVNVSPGTVANSASVRFTEPFIFDLPYSFTAEAYYQQFYREAWVEQHAGGSLSLTKTFEPAVVKRLDPFWSAKTVPIWSAGVTLQAEDVDIRDVQDFFPATDRVNVLDPVTHEPQLNGAGDPVTQLRSRRAPDVLNGVGHTAITNAGLIVRRDSTNHGPLTYQGNNFVFTYKYFGAAGGSAHFHQFTVGADQYFQVARDVLDRRTVLAVHAGADYNTPDAPFFERFYGGGLAELPIRGFQYRGVGPRAGRDLDPIGGDFALVGSVELNFPIFGDNLRGVVFDDIGTVESDIRIHQIRDSVGVGVRVVIPFLGQRPLAFDLAFPVLKADDDLRQVFSFGLRT